MLMSFLGRQNHSGYQLAGWGREKRNAGNNNPFAGDTSRSVPCRVMASSLHGSLCSSLAERGRQFSQLKSFSLHVLRVYKGSGGSSPDWKTPRLTSWLCFCRQASTNLLSFGYLERRRENPA